MNVQKQTEKAPKAFPLKRPSAPDNDCSVVRLISFSILPQNASRCPYQGLWEPPVTNAIEVAWNRGRLDTTNQLLGVNLFNERDKPTNGEFISLIAEKAAGE